MIDLEIQFRSSVKALSSALNVYEEEENKSNKKIHDVVMALLEICHANLEKTGGVVYELDTMNYITQLDTIRTKLLGPETKKIEKIPRYESPPPFLRQESCASDVSQQSDEIQAACIPKWIEKSGI